MRRAYQVEAIRAAERALMDLLPDGALMNRAAAGLAAVCGSLLARYPGRVYGARVVVLAGSGDNGGDALYAGARLARRGAAVTAIAAAPKVHEGGTAALRAAGGRVTGNADAIARADLIIDGLLGIGGRGGLREPFAGLAAAAKMMRKYPQVLVNVPGDASRLGPEVSEAVTRAEETLGDNGRVLVRPSGTEPAIRLMVQAADAVLAEQVIGQLAAEVRLALAGH